MAPSGPTQVRGIQEGSFGDDLKAFLEGADVALACGAAVLEVGLNPFADAGCVVAGRRDQVFLDTKFGYVPNPSIPGGIGADGSPAYVRKAIEGSLERLGVEMIDL